MFPREPGPPLHRSGTPRTRTTRAAGSGASTPRYRGFARPGGQGGASELDLPGERRQLGREDVARSSPAADPGRSRSLASTTVVIDDAETLTGTTHLWRRGLSFDSPFAAAVFDAALAPGRPDPTANPNQNPIVTDEDAWNPDGSLRPGFNPATLLAALMANDIHDEFNDPTPSSASLRRAGRARRTHDITKIAPDRHPKRELDRIISVPTEMAFQIRRPEPPPSASEGPPSWWSAFGRAGAASAPRRVALSP